MATTHRALTNLYDFNTMVVNLALGALDDEKAKKQPAGKFNSPGWIVGHVIAARYLALKMAGFGEDNSWEKRFMGPDNQGNRDLPTVEELRSAWKAVTEKVSACLRTEDLDRDLGNAPLPIADHSVAGVFSFFAWHESYHLGQLGAFHEEVGIPTVQSLVHAAHSKQKG